VVGGTAVLTPGLERGTAGTIRLLLGPVGALLGAPDGWIGGANVCVGAAGVAATSGFDSSGGGGACLGAVAGAGVVDWLVGLAVTFVSVGFVESVSAAFD
jgi:hypothetical protein